MVLDVLQIRILFGQLVSWKKSSFVAMSGTDEISNSCRPHPQLKVRAVQAEAEQDKPRVCSTG